MIETKGRFDLDKLRDRTSAGAGAPKVGAQGPPRRLAICIRSCYYIYAIRNLQQLTEGACGKPSPATPPLRAMADWWCVVSGHGYRDCPTELAKTMRRGSRVKAAAWRPPAARDAEFFIAIVTEIQKCDSESAARARFQIDFNKKNGTFGSKLQNCQKIDVLKVFRATASFRIHFHDFTIIRDDFAAASSALQVAPPAPAGGDEVDHYANLGLEPGTYGRDTLRAAYLTHAKLYHPDRGNGLGDASRFIAARDAYEALTGTRPEARGVLVCPREQLVELNTSIADTALKSELDTLVNYENDLKAELRRVQAKKDAIFHTVGSKRQLEKRELAKEFVVRFKRSARYWEEADLKKWFQLGREPTDTREEEEIQEAIYGPDLRGSNYDLDPYIRFERVYKTGMSMNKNLKVSMGCDSIDAVDNGRDMILPLIKVWGPPYRKQLEELGFAVKLLDDLWSDNAYVQLYQRGLIPDPPHHGVPLDVRRAAVLSEQTRAEEVSDFSPGMCAPHRQAIMDIARKDDAANCKNMHENIKREEKEEFKLWGGRRPNNMAELRISESGGSLRCSLSDWEHAPNLRIIRDRDPEPEPENQEEPGTTVVTVVTKRLRSPDEDSYAPNKRACGSEIQKLVDDDDAQLGLAMPEED